MKHQLNTANFSTKLSVSNEWWAIINFFKQKLYTKIARAACYQGYNEYIPIEIFKPVDSSMHHQEYTVVCFISTLTKTNNFDHFDKDAIGVTKHRA